MEDENETIFNPAGIEIAKISKSNKRSTSRIFLLENTCFNKKNANVTIPNAEYSNAIIDPYGKFTVGLISNM
ncbi:hypothetical protein [Streptococcus uberis]|jgi:hypothetical protein|uniref:hypothetical protein n=1 Tax=Streptococcus uberis TaxID=1349 RepID=UPI003D788E15